MTDELYPVEDELVTITIKIGKKHKEELSEKPILLVDIEEGKVVSGGIVVDEEKALSTPCHGYDLGEGKRMLWSKGVIGTLSLPEQLKYCKAGMEIKPAPPRLAERIRALREAGIKFD